MAAIGEDVYCTLVMSDSYLPGAAVLAHSLRDAGTEKKLAALITLDTLSAATITELKELYDYLITVDRIRNPNPSNLYLMDRADLSFAFTKINLWRQTQFRKIVYLDADIVALRAPDELFDVTIPFAAAPDVGWPDAFNTGVMVITPNMGEYWALQTMAASADSFDGADQGLLNQYYEHRSWHRLSFTYNTTPNAQYQWEPAYRYYKRDIKMVHFIGKHKPWMKGRQSASGTGVYNELLSRWWAVYDRHLKQPPAPPAARAAATIKEHVSGGAGTRQGDNGPSDVGQSLSQASQNLGSPPAVEEPLSDPISVADNLTRSSQPEPIIKLQEFSAPRMEWDATRSAPPAVSRPEAMEFPTKQYTFNESSQLFNPPKSYPEPPKDMWYEVPKEKPTVEERPKPLFPWEKDRVMPKATRIFADDVSSPQSTPWQPLTMTVDELEVNSGPASDSAGLPPFNETWQSFNSRSVNAWDSVPGIENYIRSVMEQQSPKKNRPTAIQIPSTEGQILSPPLNIEQRKESLVLTDFPTAVERPSLPVTPAPVRRPTFWGEERDQTGALPAAEGVPNQVDWNPEAQLDSLRRGSLIEIEHLKSPPPGKPVPSREMPEQFAAIEDTK